MHMSLRAVTVLMRRYDWHMMAPPPVNRRLTCEWNDDLLRRLRGGAGGGGSDGTHYMQLSLTTRVGGMSEALGANGATALPMRSSGPAPLLRALEGAVRDGPMARLASRLGPWQSSMLYVGPVGTLAPCHWDALDNVFVQLAGVKHVLLFPPDTGGMRAFPGDHPCASPLTPANALVTRHAH